MNNKKPSRNWFGYLTVDNVDEIVGVLKEMLEGQKYTFVSMSWLGEGFEPKVDVRTSQSLKDDAFSIHRQRTDYAGFNVGDSYGIWSLSTSGSFFNFEYNKVTIQHESTSGNKVTWVIALQ